MLIPLVGIDERDDFLFRKGIAGVKIEVAANQQLPICGVVAPGGKRRAPHQREVLQRVANIVGGMEVQEARVGWRDEIKRIGSGTRKAVDFGLIGGGYVIG